MVRNSIYLDCKLFGSGTVSLFCVCKMLNMVMLWSITKVPSYTIIHFTSTYVNHHSCLNESLTNPCSFQNQYQVCFGTSSISIFILEVVNVTYVESGIRKSHQLVDWLLLVLFLQKCKFSNLYFHRKFTPSVCISIYCNIYINLFDTYFYVRTILKLTI